MYIILQQQAQQPLAKQFISDPLKVFAPEGGYMATAGLAPPLRSAMVVVDMVTAAEGEAGRVGEGSGGQKDEQVRARRCGGESPAGGGGGGGVARSQSTCGEKALVRPPSEENLRGKGEAFSSTPLRPHLGLSGSLLNEQQR